MVFVICTYIKDYMQQFYGVVLISANSDNTLTGIGEYIFDEYYKKDGLVPNDIIVRQWQLKIFERINYLNKGFWCWENILSRHDLLQGMIRLK